MTAYECDRCGALFKRNCVPKTTITIDQHPNGFERLDLCNKCQKELENWIGGLSFDSNLNPTLNSGIDFETREKPFTIDYSMRTINGNWLPRKDGDV